MTQLETTQLRRDTLVRPAGALGTCGFSPKAWTVAVMDSDDHPIDAFLTANPNWTRDEVTI